MDCVVGRAARPKKLVGSVAAALVFAAVISQPMAAKAEHGAGGSRGGSGSGSFRGGGGFHGGAFHGGGGFQGGGFHAQGFHAQGFQGGGFHGGFHHRGFPYGFGGAGAGFALGLGSAYAPFGWDYYYDPYAGFYGYPDYGYSPSPAQYWYYCSDPAGYYPYVSECNTGWQAVQPG